MIAKLYGSYVLICDVCGNKTDKQFPSFHDVVECKKAEGWISQKHNGEWEDVCPECQD